MLAAGFWIVAACESEQNQHSVSDDEAVLTGEFIFKGAQPAYVELPAIHYKFADRERREIRLDDEDRFEMRFEVDESKVVWIHYDDHQYPIYLKKGERIDLEMDGADFPENIRQSGGDESANRQYQHYMQELSDIQDKIDEEAENFARDPDSPMLGYYADRIELAEEKLSDTSLGFIVHRTRGEYIVKALEQIRHHRQTEGFDAEAARSEVLEKAREMGVLTETSLKAQRAGIRDIAHAYAMSYGIEERLEEEYGEGLGAYELNRLAYEELDSARRRVVEYIDSRAAEAHARMYLVAERIGEAPFEQAEPTFHQYVEEFSEFDEYIDFLQTHYRQVKSIQPGEQAVEFAYDNIDGQSYSPKDFEGEYVLLYFWASWCANCAYQKPYMKDIYETYREEGFEIIAISIDEEKEAWEQAIHQNDYPWVDLYAGDGFQQETFMRYRAGSIPFYVLIDPDGRIEGVNHVRPSLDLEEELERKF